jgi:hypothetical protein
MKGGQGRRGSSADGKHEVGYARPPVHTRFKKGQSGNPKGRPRGSRSVATILHKILGEKVSVREGDKVWLISNMEAVVRRLTMKAIKGEQNAIKTVLALAKETDQLEDRPESRSITVEFVSPDGSRSRTPPFEDDQATGSSASGRALDR